VALITAADDIESLSIVLNGDGLILLDFWAPWCGPCRMLSTILEEAQNDLPNDLAIVKINVDEAKEIAAEYGIQSLPTLIILENRVTLSSKAGFVSKSALVQWFHDTIGVRQEC
jgi:thioredoxin 1